MISTIKSNFTTSLYFLGLYKQISKLNKDLWSDISLYDVPTYKIPLMVNEAVIQVKLQLQRCSETKKSSPRAD